MDDNFVLFRGKVKSVVFTFKPRVVPRLRRFTVTFHGGGDTSGGLTGRYGVHPHQKRRGLERVREGSIESNIVLEPVRVRIE